MRAAWLLASVALAGCTTEVSFVELTGPEGNATLRCGGEATLSVVAHGNVTVNVTDGGGAHVRAGPYAGDGGMEQLEGEPGRWAITMVGIDGNDSAVLMCRAGSWW